MPDGTHMSNETLLHKASEALSSRVKDVLGYRAVDLAYEHAAEARRDTLHAIRDLASDLHDLAEQMEDDPVYVPNSDQAYDDWVSGTQLQ